MADKKKELQQKIADIQANIDSSEFSEGIKERLRDKKKKLEEDLTALGDKPAKVFKTSAEKKTEKKVATPSQRKKDPYLSADSIVHKKAAVKKAGVSKVTRKEADKAKPVKGHKVTKPAKAKKADDDDDSDTITIGGVTLSKKGCPDGYDAFVAAKKLRSKSAEKSEKKPSIEKAHHSFYTGIGQIFESVAKSKVEGDPALVKKALKGFKADINRGFDRLTGILSAAKVKELKDALNKIDEIIDSIE